MKRGEWRVAGSEVLILRCAAVRLRPPRANVNSAVKPGVGARRRRLDWSKQRASSRRRLALLAQEGQATGREGRMFSITVVPGCLTPTRRRPQSAALPGYFC